MRTLLLALTCLLGCRTWQPLTNVERERVATFDHYWQELANAYPLFGQQQVPWAELRNRYRAAVPFAVRPHEFYHLLTGMFSELGDVHVSFRAPAERWIDAGVPPTSLLDLDGFRLMPIEGRLHVVGWPAGLAPEPPDGAASRQRFPELWRVEGFPVVVSLVANLLQGPPGSPVELQLRWSDGCLTRHVLHRPPAPARRSPSPLAHLERGAANWRSIGGTPFTWLEITTLGDELPLADVDDAILGALGRGGLVLDLRRNLGGRWSVTQKVVERFLRDPINLVFVEPDASTLGGLITLDVFASSTWQPRRPVYDGPLVVLTSSLTASMAEHAARLLQRHAGGIVIGERTVGAEAGIVEVRGRDGGELRFGALRIVDSTGVGLQAEGVVPDIAVRLTLADVEQRGPEGAARDWEERLLSAAAKVLRARSPVQAAVGDELAPTVARESSSDVR